MSKVYFFYLTIFQIAFFLIEASAQQTFIKSYTGPHSQWAYGMAEASDGNFVLVGSTNSFGIDSMDICLIKVDTNGSMIWTKTYGGSDDDYGSSITKLDDGGFIIGGSTESFSGGKEDVYIIRTDSAGNLIWSRTFESTNDANCKFVGGTNDSCIIVMGLTSGYGDGYTQPFLIKLNDSGDTLWTKVYDGLSDGTEVYISAQKTNDGGFILVGWHEAYMWIYSEILVLKTDYAGNPLWTNKIQFCDGSHGNGPSDDAGYSIDLTSDGGFIISGSSFGCSYDAFIIKFNSNGGISWGHNYYTNNSSLNIESVRQTTEGGYLLCGYIDSFGIAKANAVIIKIDSSGNPSWSKEFGTPINSDYLWCATNSMTNKYYALGQSIDDNNSSNFFILKTDNLGNLGCNEASTSILHFPILQSGSPPGGSFMYSLKTEFILGYPNTQTSSVTFQTFGCLDEVNEFSKNNFIKIFPNPVHSNCHVEMNQLVHEGILQILNSLGQVIYEDEILDTSIKELDLKNITAGFYFIRLTDKNNTFTTLLLKE